VLSIKYLTDLILKTKRNFVPSLPELMLKISFFLFGKL